MIESVRLRTFALRLAAMVLAVLPGRAFALETVLVSEGSSMSYLANTANPGLGITWTAEAFVPSGWSSGVYGVGYETAAGAEALLATDLGAPANSVYTRSTFTIADVSEVASVHLAADWDDGYIAWINGVEVFRSSQMPVGTPAWNSIAASHESSNNAEPSYGTVNNVTAAALGALHNGTNVLAVGVWNTGISSSDLVVVPRLSINRDQAVTRGPYLQTGTPTSVIVKWRTLVASDSCVRYGTTAGSLGSMECDGSSTVDHAVTLGGLTADTKYYYSVGSSTEEMAGNTPDHSFVTSPPAGTPKATRVWVLGDSGTANADAAAVRDAYYAVTGSTTTDLWLMLGDNAYNDGTDSEFQQAVFETYPTMLQSAVLWPTLGNHDGITANSSTQSGPYYDIFSLPTAAEAGGFASGTEAYYSFDYGDIHFICLESYETDRSPGGAMLTWLAADLADTTANWIVVFFHHPPYSKGSHDSDVETPLVEMRENALPILEAGGADLVLTGHSHSYERSFLLDGHHDVSGTLDPGMILDGSSGRDADMGPYLKPGGGPAPYEGAVYVVAGSSGQVDSGTLDHPAMFVSEVELGSLILEFDGDRLDVTFLDDTAAEIDTFAIEKVPPAPVCGDGFEEGSEECDDGNADETDACLSDCTDASCGDGFTHTGVEECDDGNLNDADDCRNDCTIATCGDGVTNSVLEECDDGNADDTDACLSSCQNASCGDGFTRTGVEECDDANAVETDACLNDCTNAACGDGIVQSGIEACDDGNASDTDACVAGCTAASCGDGFVRTGVEGCDDGNVAAGDGCSPACAVTCSAVPRGDCRLGEKAKLRLSVPPDPARSQLRWTWLRGPAIAEGELGDPTSAGIYDVCLYPDVPGAGDLAAEVRVPEGPPWSSLDGRGYSYKDRDGLAGGITGLRIGIGDALRTKLKLAGRGTALPANLLPAASYTIQLVDREGDGCWSSAFATGDATATSFKAKTP